LRVITCATDSCSAAPALSASTRMIMVFTIMPDSLAAAVGPRRGESMRNCANDYLCCCRRATSRSSRARYCRSNRSLRDCWREGIIGSESAQNSLQ
jgi:hypothetical protein